MNSESPTPQIVMSKEDNVNTNECYLSATIGGLLDMVIYSKRFLAVLEFKQMNNEFEGFLRQVRSYVKSLRTIEAEGLKRKVKGVIIYTEMESMYDIGRIQKCSADKLHEALLHLLGGFPENA